jgi:hypothetical protein
MKKDPFVYTPNPNIRLVLNGGTSVLDSVTIPVSWHFSEDIIRKKPRFVLICDHEDSLEKMAGRSSTHCQSAYRHLFRADELMGYIQLRRAGPHFFTIFVIYGDAVDALSIAGVFMRKEGASFKDSLWKPSILTNNGDKHYSGCEMTSVEFEAPAGLFAKRSETALGKALWAWTNRWFSEPPADQCHYRKRKFIAYPIQPPLVLIAGLLRTAYTIVASALLLFFGWRPEPFFKNVRNAFLEPSRFTYNLRRYREWRRWRGVSYLGDRAKDFIPPWTVPSLLVFGTIIAGLLTIFVYAVVVLMDWREVNYAPLLMLALVMVAFVAFSALIRILLTPSRIEARRERRALRNEQRAQQETMKRRAREERETEFLRQHASLRDVPPTADPKRIMPFVPMPVRFHLSFWAAKSKVCRPFEK